MELINAIGRRKAAVARIYLSEGTGEITINNKDLKTYFPVGTLQYIVEQPFNILEVAGKYNVKANLDGGGIKGQAEALRLAISRAFVKLDETNKRIAESTVKDVAGFLFPPVTELKTELESPESESFSHYLELSATLYRSLSEATGYNLAVLKG